MLKTDVVDRVNGVVREELGLAGDHPLTPETDLIDLGCDSLDIVEIAMALEEEFEQEIPDEKLEDEPATMATLYRAVGWVAPEP